MAQDAPPAEDLVATVRELLEGRLLPGLEGEARYYTRVAVHLLGIVEREMRLAPESDAAERARLQTLLGAGEDEDLRALNRELAARIREGGFAGRSQELLAHLRETAREKLRIANPRRLRS